MLQRKDDVMRNADVGPKVPRSGLAKFFMTRESILAGLGLTRCPGDLIVAPSSCPGCIVRRFLKRDVLDLQPLEPVVQMLRQRLPSERTRRRAFSPLGRTRPDRFQCGQLVLSVGVRLRDRHALHVPVRLDQDQRIVLRWLHTLWAASLRIIFGRTRCH